MKAKNKLTEVVGTRLTKEDVGWLEKIATDNDIPSSNVVRMIIATARKKNWKIVVESED